jgi:hypothetical protein
MLDAIKLIVLLIVGLVISIGLVYVGSIVIMWLLGVGAVLLIVGLAFVIVTYFWDLIVSKS